MKRALVALLLVSCAGEAPSSHEAPAHVEHPVAEGALATVHLTPRAVERLGIETVSVERRAVRSARIVGGETVVPPGGTMMVAAPVAGLVRLDPSRPLVAGASVEAGAVLLRLVPVAPIDRDARARSDREVAAATAVLEAATAQLARQDQLVREGAGAQRALDDARSAHDVARADLVSARAQRRTVIATPLLSDTAMTVRAPAAGVLRAVSIAPDQSVAAGAPLVELVALDTLWVRVPVYAGDLRALEEEGFARVSPLGARAHSIEARPLPGPPTADAARATVDRYYALGDGSASFRPGERVIVEVPLRAHRDERTVPWSSIVYDASGGAWVYTSPDTNTYRRERVDVARRAGDDAVIVHGPDVGARVVSVGAAELYGTEFEPGH